MKKKINQSNPVSTSNSTSIGGLIEQVRAEFSRVTGFSIKTSKDDECVSFWELEHGFELSDYVKVIEYDWNDEKQREYYRSNPMALSVSSMFNPKRGDILHDIVRSYDIREKLSLKSPLPTFNVSKTVQTHKLSMSCCKGVFDRVMEFDGKAWVWNDESRQDYENHIAFCNKMNEGDKMKKIEIKEYKREENLAPKDDLNCEKNDDESDQPDW